MRRSFVMLLAVVACTLSLASCAVTSSSPPPPAGAPTHGTPPRETGRAYATALLNRAALPAGAVGVRRQPTPLLDGISDYFAMVHLDRLYVLHRPVDMERFVADHAPHGSTSGGIETGVLSNHVLETGYSLRLATTSRHAAFVELDYSVGSATRGIDELRLDAWVEWAPVLETAELPSEGIVTVTGYQDQALDGFGSDPTTVTLSPRQASRLRAVLAGLPTAVNRGLVCMEDTRAFTIRVLTRRGVHATWTATARTCPGVVGIGSEHHHAALLADECSLERLISAFLVHASGSYRNELVAGCPGARDV